MNAEAVRHVEHIESAATTCLQGAGVVLEMVPWHNLWRLGKGRQREESETKRDRQIFGRCIAVPKE
jgi:hypothetical protein